MRSMLLPKQKIMTGDICCESPLVGEPLCHRELEWRRPLSCAWAWIKESGTFALRVVL